jgi:phage gpG-like protein
MAGIRSEYTLEIAANDLRALARKLEAPPEKFLKTCSRLVAEDAKTNFDKSCTPDDQPWPPLKFSRARGGDVPLRDRGILMASMQGRGSNSIVRITGAVLEQGTNIEYARIQNDGGTIVPKKGKYLAIPLTPEAARAGSPRPGNGHSGFPRPLVVRIGKRGGVLIEADPTKAAGVAKRMLKRSQKRLKDAETRVRKGRGRNGDAALIQYLRAHIAKTKERVAKRVKKARTAGKVQYALTKKVVLIGRQFIGFGKRLIGKLEKARDDFFGIGEK